LKLKKRKDQRRNQGTENHEIIKNREDKTTASKTIAKEKPH